MYKNVVIIGAGGHGKVLSDIVEKSGDIVYGFLDDNREKNELVLNKYSILGKTSECQKIQSANQDIEFIIAVGDNTIRKKVFDNYNLNYYTAIHPTSVIATNVSIGEGTAIMANVCINEDTVVGKNCIINTATVIEHDNSIKDHVHISSNSTLCGNVNVGDLAYIGAGSVIKRNVKIKQNCNIEVGSVILEDVD